MEAKTPLPNAKILAYELMETESERKFGLFTEKALNVISFVVVLGACAALFLVGVMLSQQQFSGDEPLEYCDECFQALPDECGLLATTLYPFSRDLPNQRYNRWQYNGNLGKSSKYEAYTSASTVFRAIFGDITARKESLIFRWTRDAVSQKETTFNDTGRYYAKYNETLTKMIKFAWEYLYSMDVYDSSQVTDLQSMCAAQYATNKFYMNLTKHEISSLSVNYTSPHYDNDGSLEVWATVYQQIVGAYGPLVVVFNPETPRKKNNYALPRTVDLNMWNLQNNGFFVSRDNTTWDDTGEFVTAGWRYSSEIAGLFLYVPRISNVTKECDYMLTHCKNDTLVRNRTITEIPPNKIVFGFFKVEHRGASYIVVLDGHKNTGNLSQCIEQGKDGRFYHCVYPPWPFGEPTPRFPIRTNERVRTIGFISACSSDSVSCEIPKKLLDKYRGSESSFTITDDVVEYISNTRWKDPLMPELEKKLYFYALNSTAVVGYQKELVLDYQQL